MNKISRILLLAVTIMCLFAGVAAATKLDVMDKHGDKVGSNKHVKIDHTFSRNGHSDSHEKETDEDGQIYDDVESDHPGDKIESGDEGRCDEDRDGKYEEFEDKDCHTEPSITSIPEFPTLALPIAGVIGMLFLFQHRNKKE